MALLQIAEPGLSSNPHQRNIAIGIDLGTTNSLVATVKSGKAVVLSNLQKQALLPSVVYYGKNLVIKVGHAALLERINDPANTIISVKRLMGQSLKDLNARVNYPYHFTKHEGIIEIITHQGIKNPIQISSDILRALKEIAIANLGEEPMGAVITVPAYFDDNQRQATKQAAELAGLNVLRLLNEPTAAAIAYGLDSKNEGTFCVFDLGGGTLDVSILRLNQGVFEVLAVSGDTHLGGDDFDQQLYDYIVEKSQLTKLSPNDMAQLLTLAKTSKEQLTNQPQINLTSQLSNQQAINLSITQGELPKVWHSLLNRILIPVKKALRDAKLSIQDIDEIIMVGGSTRMPQVRQIIANFFNKQLLTTIDPDQVVAIGAAIQADVLAGNRKDDWLLLDVTPLSLGIETMGGLVEKIIPRNSTLPISRAQDFTTYQDGQTAMTIHVVQGEREMVADCRSLAKFSLKGIPPMIAGAARIRITFQIDADGLLSVSAMEQSSGSKSHIEVKPSFGLTDEQVSQMLQASISHAKDDILNRQLAEEIINAQGLINSMQTAMQQDEQLLTANEQQQFIQAIKELKQALSLNLPTSSKTAKLKELINHLNTLTQDFAARRMNQAIKKSLNGKAINQLEDFTQAK